VYVLYIIMNNDINPYDHLHNTSFNHGQYDDTIQLQHTVHDTINTHSKESWCIPSTQTYGKIMSFIKIHFYTYMVLGLMIGILSSNIYNSYVFTTILQNLHTPSPIELFITSLQMDYNFVLNFLQTNNLTFQNFAHTINSSLGLFTNMSHNAYLACTSDLLIPTIEHEKCYQT
jgi:hypothetical protein